MVNVSALRSARSAVALAESKLVRVAASPRSKEAHVTAAHVKLDKANSAVAAITATIKARTVVKVS